MKEKFEQAGKGLGILFFGSIIGMVCMVAIMIILSILQVRNVMVTVALTNAIGTAVRLYGLFVARNSHPKFQKALYVSVVVFVLSLRVFFPLDAIINGLLNIAGIAVGFLSLYFTCTAAGELLAEKGDAEQAARAVLIWKIFAGYTAVAILGTAMSWIPALAGLTKVVTSIGNMIALAACILMFFFDYQASKSLYPRKSDQEKGLR